MSPLVIALILATQQSATLLCQLDSFSEDIQADFQKVEVAGEYRIGFEVRAFTPAGSSERWWVVSKDLNELMRAEGTTIPRVVLRGLLSPKGKYGHAGGYQRCLADPKLLKVLRSPTGNQAGVRYWPEAAVQES